MKPYVIHDANGNITEVGFADNKHLDDLKAGGMNVVIGQGTSTAHYVDTETATICQRRPAHISLADSHVVAGQAFELTLPYPVKNGVAMVTQPNGATKRVGFSGSRFSIPANEAGFYQVLVSDPSLFTAAIALHATMPLPEAA